MTHRGSTLFLAATLLGLPSCGGGGGGGGGPTDPPSPPTITSVTPAEARAGESVTIAGSEFGNDAAAVTVTFRGESAAVDAVSDASITATVPEIAPGDATVVVTVAGRTSDPAAFRVLQSPPVVTSLEPNPVRAGETLVIRGRNFGAETNGLRTAQGNVRIQLGERAIPVTRISMDELEAVLPLDLATGTFPLTVDVGDLSSDPIDIEIQFFSIEGFWVPSMSSAVTFNDCGIGAPVGDPFQYGFTFTDDGSGSLGGFYNGIDLSGSFDLGDGSFQLSGTYDNNLSVRLEGVAELLNQSPLLADHTWFFEYQGCRIEADVRAERETETPLRYVGGFTPFDQFHDSSQSFTLVEGHFEVPILDLITGHGVGSLPMSVEGETFAFREGSRVLIDYVSGSLMWNIGQPDLLSFDDPVPGPFCLWSPRSIQTVRGSLLATDMSEIFGEDFPAGEEIRLQLPYRSGASLTRYERSGDGSGFSRIKFAYSGFFDAIPPSSFDTSRVEICDNRRAGYGGY